MMSCNDLDRLRGASPHSSSAGWPRQAKEHLASCESCSRLQAVLDGASEVVMPEALQQKVEADILRDLHPVAPLPSVGRVIGMLLIAAACVTAAANYLLGTAGWHARSLLQATVSFVLLGASFFALASALAHWMTPGSRRFAFWPAYLFLPLLALLAANVAMFDYHANPQFVPQALSCWEIGVTCAALSAPLFWFALRRGFFLNPFARGALTGLLSGLVGITVLEIYCPQLDRLHISVAHIGAAVTAAAVGAAWGRAKGRIARLSP
jgi:Negative regulator of sigma F